MARAEEPQNTGLTQLGDSPFPRPVGVTDLAVSATGPLSFFVTGLRGGTAYAITCRLKTTLPATGSALCVTDEIYFGKSSVLSLPDTNGQWRHAALFFRSAPGTTDADVLMGVRRSGARDDRFAVEEFRVREATEVEYASAYASWRAQFPYRDLSPRPEDGKNLATFLAKLENPLIPAEPLRVIGIGSSYTNMLGNGERLIQWIREKFPQAPPILYEKHVGSAVEYDFTRGWMRQHVLGRQPDLVILYSGGKSADLEKLLADFRAHSSADVVVASLHLRERDEVITEATINAPEWDAIREVALRFGCEWVDNRREWAAYLQSHQKPIEWLLKDAVHQSDHGALVINENICRHFVPGLGGKVQNETFFPFEKGGVPRLAFTGNRIDLVGRRRPDGGTLAAATIRIDGIPLDELPVFVTTVIVPGAKNYRPERGSAADRSPHQIMLGDSGKIVPQRWTIRSFGDAGAYELFGSITGNDGFGHNGDNFTGSSGQITVPSELWRRRLEADGVTYSNRDGDTFTWEVRRAVATGEIHFRGSQSELFSASLADQLENGTHILEWQAGAGIDIVGFRVHRPPHGRK
jgi:hypothetical protein